MLRVRRYEGRRGGRGHSANAQRAAVPRDENKVESEATRTLPGQL